MLGRLVGRTFGSDPENNGSNPFLASKIFIVVREQVRSLRKTENL